MDSTKTHKDWALIEGYIERLMGDDKDLFENKELWLHVSIHGKIILPFPHPTIPGLEDMKNFPCRSFSPEARKKRAEALMSISRSRCAAKLRRHNLISFDQELEARVLCDIAWDRARHICRADAIEKLRTAPKSSAVGRLRLSIIHAIPELLQLYEARELAAAAKKRKPIATTQRGRL